jgi:hypothetical protein
MSGTDILRSSSSVYPRWRQAALFTFTSLER